jgi:CBS domain-containing protein
MASSELTDIQRFLEQTSPFAELGSELLAMVSGNLQIIYRRRGSPVLLEQQLYLLRSGAVELRNSDGTLIDQIGPGDGFGLRNLVDHNGCDSAHCSEDSLLYILADGLFEKLCELNKPFRRFFSVPHQSRIRLAVANRGDTLSLTATVGSLLQRSPVTIDSSTSIRAAAQRMSDERLSSMLVCEHGQLVGMFTDSDLRRRVVAQGLDTAQPVAGVMTAKPITVTTSSFVFEAIVAMSQHNIHHIPVVDGGGELAGLLTTTDLIRAQRSQPVFLVGEIFKAASAEQLAEIATAVPDLFARLVEADGRAGDISRLLTVVSDAITQRLLQLGEAQLGVAPVGYAWLGFGSQGREDQNISSDQDNALLLDDAYQAAVHGDYFAKLTQWVCDGLDRCGYVYCPGGIMAMNPQWRLTARRWQKQFRQWMAEPEPKAVMHTSIFFDLRVIAGTASLVKPLQQTIIQGAADNRIFLAHLAANCLKHTPPLGFFRNLVVEGRGDHKDQLDLKHKGSITITDLGRLYALANSVTSINTQERLRDLADIGALNRKDVRNLLDANEFINTIRLQHQAQALARGEQPDNYVSPSSLSSLQRSHLKDAFNVIKRSQELIARNFPGAGV